MDRKKAVLLTLFASEGQAEEAADSALFVKRVMLAVRVRQRKQRSLRLLACLPAAAGMGGLAMALLPSLDAVIAAGSSVFLQLAPYVFQALRDGGLLLPAALLAVTLLGPVVADHLQEP